MVRVPVAKRGIRRHMSSKGPNRSSVGDAVWS